MLKEFTMNTGNVKILSQFNLKFMKKVFLSSILVLGLLLNFGCVKNSDMEISPSSMQLSPEKGDTIAILKTTLGEIKMLLYVKEAPETTKNFIELAKAGKYDDTIFHRVIDNFMIQGGDFEKRNGFGGYSYKGPGTYLEDEFGENLVHIYGAVSMANGGPNTAGSQFFIVQAENGTPWLNGKHAIFGYIYEGMNTVEKIADMETDDFDKPTKDIVVETITIEEFK